jgi:hypothetical protein
MSATDEGGLTRIERQHEHGNAVVLMRKWRAQLLFYRSRISFFDDAAGWMETSSSEGTYCEHPVRSASFRVAQTVTNNTWTEVTNLSGAPYFG